MGGFRASALGPGLAAGQTFYEGPTDIHVVGRNASSTAAANFVVGLLKAEGDPSRRQRVMPG
jgi:hypothetical protein